MPATAGTYNYRWVGAGAVVAASATGSFTVLADAITVQQDGPCEPWITADDVAQCCGVQESSSTEIYDTAAYTAQTLLYELSGRLYGGTCGPVTARPCTDGCSCWPFQSLAYASGGSRYIFTGNWGYWGAWGWGDSRNCGCGCLPQVKLAGYPVRAVSQVKIDGDILDPSEYRLDENRYVTRLNDAFWPACQDLSLPDTDEGTFSISYIYGQEPPELGRQAAAQLACEVYKECTTGTCALPKGTTRVTRQGVTIEKLAFTSWGFTSRGTRGGRFSGWATGLPLVDAFLNTHNRTGILRRPTFWAPGRRYAKQVG